MATYRGKLHGGKPVLGIHVARGEFGEITRFYYILISNIILTYSYIFTYKSTSSGYNSYTDQPIK